MSKLISTNNILNNSLTNPEKEFIDLLGHAFEKRRSYNFGRIFALLSLKADSIEKGLDQQQIFEIINSNFSENKLSISTVSRVLKSLEQSNYCESIPTENRRRKYFTTSSFKELILTRLSQNFIEWKKLAEDLNKLKANISPEDTENASLLTLVSTFHLIYQIIVEDYEKLMSSISKRIQNL